MLIIYVDLQQMALEYIIYLKCELQYEFAVRTSNIKFSSLSLGVLKGFGFCITNIHTSFK